MLSPSSSEFEGSSTSSSSPSNLASKSTSSSNLHLDSFEFPSFETLTLRDSNFRKFEETKKKITCLKKRINRLSENLEDAKVEATILGHIRSKKVTVYKMRPKKKTRKKQGHRNDLTRVLVDKITVGGKSI